VSGNNEREVETMNLITNGTFATALALSILGSGAAGAQMTPSTQNPPPLMDKAPAQSTMPEAKEIQGIIRSVDRATQTVTLDDGTTLTIPSSVKVTPNALQKGAKVSAKYEEQGGKRVVTSLHIEPPSKS
jgi:Cu/Ag efflux protein CusF